MDNIKEYILCAAIHYPNGDTVTHNSGAKNIERGLVVTGYRHYHCFSLLCLLYPDGRYLKDEERLIQGFLTSKNRFVDRKEAGEIAYSVEQIKGLTNCLFSEDLYFIHNPIKG